MMQYINGETPSVRVAIGDRRYGSVFYERIQNMTSLKKLIKLPIIILFISLNFYLYSNIHKPDELVTDWNTALQYLIEGNQRYIENHPIGYTFSENDRNILKDGQFPFAAILTCADSRVAPEIYFDERLGDIFVLRNAGNIYNPVVHGSIEYAVEHLKVPLVVVVGHSQCGAVTGAFTNTQSGGNLQNILNLISEHIEGSDNLNEAIQKNIESVVENIKQNEIITKQGTMVIGAHFDVVTGVVKFYE